MLCKLHSVYKIIHCIHCVILHRGSQIIIHYTVKGQFFAFNLEKNYTAQKKFTQTPSVVSVTNMRYAPAPFSSPHLTPQARCAIFENANASQPGSLLTGEDCAFHCCLKNPIYVLWPQIRVDCCVSI